jgi:cytochrome b pre-mRNA-processing protein 3
MHFKGRTGIVTHPGLTFRSSGGSIMLTRLFRRKGHDPVAWRLYEAIVAQGRRPEFYQVWGVPDTLDGRFDMIALHSFLVLHRLKRDHEATAALAQDLFDALFLDMDRALRELGAGDLGVGKRVKAMARGFYGRVAAYEDSLSAGEAALGRALGRNLFATVEPTAAQLSAMAAYVVRQVGTLDRQDTGQFLTGRVTFGAPPGSAVDSPVDSLVDSPVDSGRDQGEGG